MITTDEQTKTDNWRQTQQYLKPLKHQSIPNGTYDIYPAYPLGSGEIEIGFKALAEKLSNASKVVIDGYVGVFWENFRKKLNQKLEDAGLQAEWVNVADAMLAPDGIDELVSPYLGGDDPIFGTRFEGSLKDFFEEAKLEDLAPVRDAGTNISILYGCGAALADWQDAVLVYVDVPKNEIQFRSRARSVKNLGAADVENPKKMYKRFYFVDWIALNEHKESLLTRIDWVVDEQRPDEPAFFKGDTFREALNKMSETYFRVRPWFEPGAWGGQWIKKHIPELPQDPVNYAWSFELITPENGLMFSSDARLLETSFDWLMYQEHEAVLGDSADRFGYEFPIRFDFLDTFDGGKLSVQCHPSPSFIKKEFGENFTQDETYYILDCKPGAKVYLGFQEDIDPVKFRRELEQSVEKSQPVEIDKYVQSFQANKHDLFLIPHETIHCSGTDNMVLEISATPYIFTFKMYDWLRLDLQGNPRPINIERGFQNLNFGRKGKRVEEELISKPVIISKGDDWQVVHLPTHEEHFYDVHSLEFQDEIKVETNGSCHVMSLVEGNSVWLETLNGGKAIFNYAETFVVPASAESYRLINEGENEPVKVIKAFIKEESDH